MERAGRYEIVEEVGRGAMGVVYKAYDPVIGRTVAIKTMLARGLAEADFAAFRARFQFEAQSAGTLTHPNIITVYDFGEEEGMLYLAMEYLEGKSLETMLKQQLVLPIETIIPMAEQVGSALDFAHSHKIVHRDVKPANIMILNSGLVKVMDFGAAKGALTTLTTRAGQLLGTPNYMSPEQAKGRPLDGRSDIFSLGVILYELLTGEKPFYGESVTTVIYKIVHDTPIPPRELDPTIHPGLNFVVGKALAKSPDERYQSCRELVDDLKNYRNLGPMAASNETVVLTRPLSATPATMGPDAAAGTSVRAADQLAVSSNAGPESVATPVAMEMLPPDSDEDYDRDRQEPSLLVWLLPLSLLVVAVLVGLFLYHRHTTTPVAGNQPAGAPAQPAAIPASQPPATPASQPQPEATQSQPEASQPQPEAAQPQPEATQIPAAAPQPKPAENKPAAAETQETELSRPVSRPLAKPAKERAAKSAGMGSLYIRSNVPGAKILIDGNLKEGWVTPHTGQVPAGKHHISLFAEGYQSAFKEVDVTAGAELPVDFTLTPVAGLLRVQTTPSGLEVFIDGKSYGPSPVTLNLPVGFHSLRVTPPPGGAAHEQSVEVRADATNTVSLRW